MAFAKVSSAQTYLLEGYIVSVEIDISRGLYSFSIVGLPDKAVEEARDRVSAALKNSGFESPKSKNQKVVVSLAPAHIKKEGSIFDLAIAVGYLLAEEEIKQNIKDKLFLAELSLDGFLRPVTGVLPLVKKAKENGFTEIYVAPDNAKEAALIDEVKIFSPQTLRELVDHLQGKKIIEPNPPTKIKNIDKESASDLQDIKGQEAGKRGLIIAAAGNHNIALFGPAGTGKTMLARAFSGILPPLNYEEIVEVTSIHSIAGVLHQDYITTRPFRSPHHTSSYVALVGGGAFPRPGEITLAHRGALFMDEFPEFDRRVMESLRQPLEDKVVSISRSKGSALFPANFILIAAMNPCPCGNTGSSKVCTCSPLTIARYQKKISGPIADRIDLWIEVPLLLHRKLSDKTKSGVGSSEAREVIGKAKEFSKKRLQKIGMKIKNNGELSSKEIERSITLSNEVEELLQQSAEKLNLSPRSYHKTIKVARTIADLDESEDIKREHLLEALQYRRKEN
jgi:magnesium chelatase family protein